MLKTIKCIAGRFKRLKYFNGMLLTETDFQEEQTYFREKIKLHNRLHGYGVVWGLCIKTKKIDDEFSSKITIKPGFAIDCKGNEIIVCNDYDVDLAEKIKRLQEQGKIKSTDECSSPPESPPKLYIGIKYCTCDAEPVTQYTSECSVDELQPQFSRVKEGFAVEILAEHELPPSPELEQVDAEEYCMKPSRFCPGAKSCDVDEHVIILGAVEIDERNVNQITDDSIDMGDRKKIMFSPRSLFDGSYLQWEDTKHALIKGICRKAGWNDIFLIIGKKLERALCILSSMGITSYELITIDNFVSNKLTFEDLINIKTSLPYAKSGSKIILITDNNKDYVLFTYHVIFPSDE